MKQGWVLMAIKLNHYDETKMRAQMTQIKLNLYDETRMRADGKHFRHRLKKPQLFKEIK